MIDEIFEIDEDFEEIERYYGKSYPFPVACIGNEHIYFNVNARQLIPSRIKWIVTTNYIVAMPTDEDDRNGYVVHQHGNSVLYTSACFPVQMRRDKKVRKGVYKVFKYKNGFCMKRNERIDEYEIS